MTKIEALAKYLECETNDIQDGLGEEEIAYTYDREEYLVLTNEEADSYARDYILNSLWAFNASFLAAHSDIDEDVIKSIQDNNKCEDNNEVFLKLIRDVDHFVSDAIMCDTRGHFLAGYDNEENEAGEYFVYRIN